MTQEVTKGSVVVVKKFIDSESTKRVGMQEMQEFWKTLSESEKLQYTNEAITLMPELAAAAKGIS